ncbi:hypothetical protein [Spiroplasma clarkii]|uniref:Uncharacterized protein n=1 Tax=Spiroplasma clarkii TaxID=2139 RepID=A0A2K8KJL9_9MOLU|nr:hypothetical protein [Spiroplasma clarkii]ATX71562.1 hypothetical protein SCLAR_v1c12620 [Spiroplasma clarkii]
MKNSKVIKQILILEFGLYRKSPMYIFLSWILALCLGIIWLEIRVGDPFVISATIATLTITNTTIVYLKSLNTHKQKQFYQRLAYNKVSSFTYIFATMLFNFLINTIGSILFFGVGLLYTEQLRYLTWFSLTIFFGAYLLFWLTCILFTYFCFSYIKSTVACQILIVAFHMITYNAMGCTFPFYSIVNIKVLNSLSYIMPNRLAMNFLQASYVQAWNFDYVDVYFAGKYDLYWRIGTNLGLILGLMFTIIGTLIILIVAKTLYLKRLKFKKIDDIAGTRAYLRKIKNAKSLAEIKQLQSNWAEKRPSSQQKSNYEKSQD